MLPKSPVYGTANELYPVLAGISTSCFSRLGLSWAAAGPERLYSRSVDIVGF